MTMRRKKKRKYYYYISKLKRYAINAIKFAIEILWILATARIVILAIMYSAVSSKIVSETIIINSIITIKASIEQIRIDKEKKAEHFRLFEQQIALMIYYFQGCGQMTPRESQKLIKIVKLARLRKQTGRKQPNEIRIHEQKEKRSNRTRTGSELLQIQRNEVPGVKVIASHPERRAQR